MFNSPGLMTRFRSWFGRLVCPLFLLLILTAEMALEPAQAAAATPDSSGALFGQLRRRRGWSMTVWYEIGGGCAAVLLIVVVIIKKRSGGKMVVVTAPSDIVGGYRLQNLMMTGQTSQVWEVVEAASGRHFAMKMLLPEKAEMPEHRALLFHEAEVGVKMAHPNVIKIITLHKGQKPGSISLWSFSRPEI